VDFRAKAAKVSADSQRFTPFGKRASAKGTAFKQKNDSFSISLAFKFGKNV
jgi:hypothetical protein